MKRFNLKLRRLRTILVCLAALNAGWLLLGYAQHALADTNVPIGSQFPLRNSVNVFNYNNTTGDLTPIPCSATITCQPSIIVANGSFNGEYAWVKIYVPRGGQANVTVQNGGGVCNGSAGVSGPNDSSDYYWQTDPGEAADVDYTLMDLDANETEISSTGATYFEAMNSQVNGITSCYDLTFPTIPSNAGTASQLAGHQAFRVFLLVAHETAVKTPTFDPWKDFRVITDNGLVGTSRPVDPSTVGGAPFGIDYMNLYYTVPESDPTDNSPVFTYSFMFSSRCDEKLGTNSVYAFDMDNHDYDPTANYYTYWYPDQANAFNYSQDISADIFQEDKSNAAAGFSLQKHFLAGSPGQTTQGYYYNTDGKTTTPAQPPYTPDILGGYGEENALGVLNYNVTPQYRYKFYINDAGYWNALQFYTGYDQFDASQYVDCFDSTCTYSTDPASGTQVTGQSIQVTVNMKNYPGVAPWPGTFGLYQLNPAGNADYPVSPAPVYANGTAQFTFNVTRGSPGTYALTYQMKTDTGLWFGQKCTLTLIFSDLGAVCTGVTPSIPPEPGEPIKFQAGFLFNNGTANTYTLNAPNSDTGYNLHVTWAPGVSVDPATLTSTPAQIRPGQNSVAAGMTLTAAYQGTLTVDLYDGAAPAGVTGLPCTYTITPATRAYFKVFNGDITAGGAFAQADGSCDTSNISYGGILGYAYPTATNGGPRGASADFGAYALGLIQGYTDPTEGAYGFYDDAPNQGSPGVAYNSLSFANQNSGGQWQVSGKPKIWSLSDGLNGGIMTGGNYPADTAGSDHCVPDYFDQAAKIAGAFLNPVSTINLSSLKTSGNDGSNVDAPGQYYYRPANGSYVRIPGGTNFDQRVTIFVQGSVFIDGNITYKPYWDPTDLSNAPYLTIIAQGNIIVDSDVSEIDGLYVAQPQSDGSHGIFATCESDSDRTQPADAHEIAFDCGKGPLTINGSVVAEQIKLIRSYGTLMDSVAGETPANNQAAEVINYTPSIVLGQPNFQPQQGTGAVTPGTLQGLTSLPPVF